MREFSVSAILVLGFLLLSMPRGLPATQAASPGRIVRDCPSCPQLVEVPGGFFQMGSEDGPPEERPRHSVWLDGFAIGRYEVTIGEFAAFLEAAVRGVSVEDYLGRCLFEDHFPRRADHPVTCVDFDHAQAYVAWLGRVTGRRYRLPSEAEWEYAARAGMTTRWYWGSDWDDRGGGCAYANGSDRSLTEVDPGAAGIFGEPADCADGFAYTAPVGAFIPNAFGLHDMAGNVWEWVEDCYFENYVGAPRDGAARIERGLCGSRVTRGGSWMHGVSFLRSAARDYGGFHASTRGMRVARTLE